MTRIRHHGLAALAICAFCSTIPLAAASEAPPESPAALVADLHRAFGEHHARAVHAKGVVLHGSFSPTAEARSLSSAAIFTAESTPATIRFSDFTGLPDIPDGAMEANPRGLAIKFLLPGGTESDIVAHSFNGFPVATANEFGALMRAIGASGPGAAKPTALDQFLAAHPLAVAFLTSQKPAPESYATCAYYGVNSFSFVSGEGARRFVRYRFVPQAGEHYLDPAAATSAGPNYLSAEIAQRLEQGPVRLDWYAQMAEPGDRIEDPSVAWPEGRTLIKLGTFNITSLDPDQARSSKGLLFLPSRVMQGIETADPMLGARTSAYPVSFGERQ